MNQSSLFNIHLHDLSQRSTIYAIYYLKYFIWNILLECKLDQQFCSIWSFLFQAVLPRLEIVAWGCYEYGHPADWLALKGLWQYSSIPFQSSVLHKAEYLVHVSHQWPGAFCMRCYMLAIGIKDQNLSEFRRWEEMSVTRVKLLPALQVHLNNYFYNL